MKRGKEEGIRIRVDSFEASHEGIKTVDVQKHCEFSGSSDLCIYFVTWNMNGQVPCEDIAKLVGEERKYDLLVMGLQEAPRNNICKLLKNTLADTHIDGEGEKKDNSLNERSGDDVNDDDEEEKEDDEESKDGTTKSKNEQANDTRS
ncbi:hypothetical protein FXO37_06872 [Capsicum annuum]|nr:hypothetical protein FXO37_06872 [Capsicum annuum]